MSLAVEGTRSTPPGLKHEYDRSTTLVQESTSDTGQTIGLRLESPGEDNTQ